MGNKSSTDTRTVIKVSRTPNKSADMSTAQAAHTPTPWHIEKHIGRYELWPTDNGQPHTNAATANRKVDAEFIVRAMNAHEELVAACHNAESLLRQIQIRVKQANDSISHELTRDAIAPLCNALAKVEVQS